jgi:Pyruvate/2-oxoacid:ferredoxin oxidoreductase gamma subunit
LQKNIAALGATAAIIGLGEEHFAPILHKEFGRKGEEAVAMNIAVFRAGWEFIVQNAAEYTGKASFAATINPEPKCSCSAMRRLRSVQ